ncbi:MAG TPA: hypothetical protein PLT43_12315, partial [Mesotoga sp.]|nr:hypothetical protein [Mesotoga sp.]
MKDLKRVLFTLLVTAVFLCFTDTAVATGRIMPEDFEYLGAFLVPQWIDGTPDAESWEWGGMSMTYDPSGDPKGKKDGFPGSIYGTGHDVWNLVSEIDIPVPVISPTRSISDLNTARTLQPF